MEEMIDSAVAGLRSAPEEPVKEGGAKKLFSKSSGKVKVKEMPKAKDREEYESWFKAADKNNDGFLSNKELKALFKSRGYKTSSKQLKAHFADLDTDQDKKVSLDEYLKAMDDVPALDHDDALNADETVIVKKTSGVTLKDKEDTMTTVTPTVTLPPFQFDHKDAIQKSVRSEISDPKPSVGYKAPSEQESSPKHTIPPYRTDWKVPEPVTIDTAQDQATKGSDRAAEIRLAFEKADKNGDGSLDLDEMKEVLRETNTGLTGKQLFDIMHKADKDNSGVINYEEFIDLYLREHHLSTN